MNRVSTVTAAVLACLTATGAARAGSAKDAWNKLVGTRFSTRPAFAFVENDPALPNVLIYGDSISIGYTPRVREKLRGTANVCRLYCNGGDSSSFIPKMTRMRETMRNRDIEGRWTFDWDVILFNVGLHDLKYVANGKRDKKNGVQVTALDDYRKNIAAIVAYLKKQHPRAALVFITTTPVPEGERGRCAGDAAKYNAAARQVLKRFPAVMINDLFAFTAPHHAKWWTRPGNVHYNTAGKNAQGDEVARVIRAALKKRKRAGGR